MNQLTPNGFDKERARRAGSPPPDPSEPVSLSAEARALAEQYAGRNISAPLLTGFTRLFETLAILAIGAALHLFYVVPTDGGDILYAVPLAAGTVLAAFFLQAVGAYRMQSLRTYVSQLGRIFAAW